VHNRVNVSVYNYKQFERVSRYKILNEDLSATHWASRSIHTLNAKKKRVRTYGKTCNRRAVVLLRTVVVVKVIVVATRILFNRVIIDTR